MNTNLSWTSALGDAYFNHQQEVLDAVQAMRKRAQDAGTLKTTAQQTVKTQGSTVVIEPADPEIVYLPEYNPWIVYGTPLIVYPGYSQEFLFVDPIIWFSVGLPIAPRHLSLGMARVGLQLAEQSRRFKPQYVYIEEPHLYP